MNLKLSYILGLISSAAMVSCYPPPAPTGDRTIKQPAQKEEVKKTVDQTDLDLDPETRRRLEEYRIKNGLDPVTGEPLKDITPDVPTDRDSVIGKKPPVKITTTDRKPIIPIKPKNDPPKIDKPKPPVPTSYPYATPVPGKQGFVFNPYTTSKVDVRGLPSGTLVSDPRNANQKFYVP